MTIHQTVYAALAAVLPNTWATELPPDVTWPAMVFDIETTPEQQWVQGGGYDQHSIGVVIYAKTMGELATYKPLIDAALEAVPGYMADGDRGDADYEDDPSLYGYYCNHVIRLTRAQG